MAQHAPARVSPTAASLASLTQAIADGLEATEPLQQLQQHTRCNICYDTYQVAMSLPCAHSFCSLCIRRCLHFTPACPLCHAAASSGDLKANFVLSQIAELVAATTAALERSVGHHVRQWAAAHVPDMDAAAMAEEAHAQSASPAAASVAPPPPPSRKVECPCCSLLVSESRINLHLDACLGKEANQVAASAAAAETAAIAAASSSATAAPSSSRLSFPVYNLLSDKQLRKLLTDLGFPCTGAAAQGLDLSRDSLVRRHREFVLRHNTEQDAAGCGLRAPISDASIVKDITRKEKARANNNIGRQGKQILLSNTFATAASEAGTVDTQHVTQSSLLSSASSARKRPKHDTSAAAGSISSKGAKKSSSLHAAPMVLDLSEDSPMPDQPVGDAAAAPASKPPAAPSSPSRQAAAAAAAAAAAVPSPFSTNLAPAAPTPPSVSDSSATAAASGAATVSSASDPWSSLIASYESKHGRRKRWRRRWGEDDSLYPALAEPIVIDEDEAHQEGTAADQQQSTGNRDEATDAVPARALAGEATNSHVTTAPKAVFSLFQPAGAASAATSSSSSPPTPAAAAAVPSTFSSSSSSPLPPSSASRPLGAASSSGVVRVSKVLCSSCHAVCRGSFPLGASVMCPRCRPAWTSKLGAGGTGSGRGAATNHRRGEHDEEKDTHPMQPAGWVLRAQQMQQSPHQHPATTLSIPPAPLHSVAAVVPAPSSASPPLAFLSDAQKQLIESRRAAALAKLQEKQRTQSSSTDNSSGEQPQGAHSESSEATQTEETGVDPEAGVQP